MNVECGMVIIELLLNLSPNSVEGLNFLYQMEIMMDHLLEL